MASLVVVGMASASPAPAAGVDGVPAFGHVFLIVGREHERQRDHARHAPYLTGTVRPSGAWLTRYYALTDGSLGDYAAMVSGQFVRCEHNNDFSFTNGDVPGQHACHQRVDNLFHQLDARGISWQEWTESATNPCDMFDHGSTWADNLFAAAPQPRAVLRRHPGPPLLRRRRPLAGMPPEGAARRRDRPERHELLRRRAGGRDRRPLRHGHPQRLRERPRPLRDATRCASSTTSSRARCPRSRPPRVRTDGLIIVVWDEGPTATRCTSAPR